ncbi:MAG: hypothetical protein TE42_05670 [Candidatus Synechococcus spongiarum SP3]|uniref:Glycosyltransferase RgtA/B/C/D-like domain-containing protein n=1 Tax=Candidatus Synechococcus spongiarum SP3 TaxID=1604020 RepID=A0A0G2HKX6_9SYNE|nr:MAG: hypothetical protein TE42_05670 [Candidatus Synechococcus spongiarum SP3]
MLLLPLLLWKFFDADQQSLLAWDEGLYMRRARLFLDQDEAWVPFSQAHHKTPGHYWIVALSMGLFGVSDIAARLPFVLLALLSAWLVYEIGSLILSRRAGVFASLILGTSYLWTVHSRMISPDLAYTSFFLAGLLLLVQEFSKSVRSSEQFCRWRLYLAGVLFASTIFLRSALAFLPLMGLVPWLLKQARGRKILRSPWLWLGLACGALPTLIWAWKSIIVYGITGLTEPLRFPLGKATEAGFPLSGFPFYVGAIFAGFLPWSPLLPFAVTSPSLWDNRDTTFRHQPMVHRRWLLLAAPATMFLLLAFTSSQHDQYALPIYPFAALLIAADLEHRLANTHAAQRFRETSHSTGWRSLPSIVIVYCCLASIVLVFYFSGGFLKIADHSDTTLDLEKLGLLFILISSAWLLGGLMVYWLHRTLQQTLKPWITYHILSAWLMIFGTVHLGFVGNYSPEVKAFLQQPHLQDTLSAAPANLVNMDGTTIAVLLKAYSPIMGRSWASFEEFKAQGSGLAWIRESDGAELDFPHAILARGHGVLLIRRAPAPTP